MSAVISSVGCEIYLDTLDSASRIDGIKDISGPNVSRGTIDVTSHSSPNNFKQYLSTRWEGGDISFDLLLDPQDAVHRRLIAKLGSGGAADATDTYIIRFPAAPGQAKWSTWEFEGFLTGLPLNLPVEDAVMASVTIQMTAAPTIVNDDTRTP